MPSKLVVRCFSVSADGYGAGPNQDVDNPMGVGGMALHEWVLPTQYFQKMLFNKDGGTTGPDNDFAVRGFENIGAWILGRTCSARCADHGRTIAGRVGGVTSRPIIAMSSC